MIDNNILDSIKPFKSREEAINEIRKYHPGYTPHTPETNTEGFYITENAYKKRTVVSWNDMKNITNIKYGTGEKNTRCRLRPCYLDVNDKNTLRWSSVVRL